MNELPDLPSEPAIEDRTLGHARFVTLRLTVFGDIRLDGDLPLQTLHEALHETNHWEWLCRPFQSFHEDIVVPHATESSLPLVMLCEPFRRNEVPAGGNAHDSAEVRPPHPVIVEFTAKMAMNWEGKRIVEWFRSDGLPLSVPARMVDCVTFFESGIVAYSFALMFGMQAGGTDLNAQQLLAISALVTSAGQIEEGGVRFAIGPAGSATKMEPQLFVRARLGALAAGEDLFGDGCPIRTPFTMLDAWVASLDRQLERPPRVRHSIAELKENRACAVSLRGFLTGFGLSSIDAAENPASDTTVANFRSTVSIGIEVIGVEWHSKVLEYAEMARRRVVPADPFSMRLAGLAQNVFDFRHQDVEEVNDSLSAAAQIGTDITFAQRGVAVRFMEDSRAFEQMHDVLGGSPYWLLVQLILGHNECLIGGLVANLEIRRRRYGLNGMIRDLLVHTNMAAGKYEGTEERLWDRFERRLRLVHYIPNIFRYKTEQQHYDLISQARGLEAQRDYLSQLDATIELTLESSARDLLALRNRRFDMRLQLLIGILGTLQAAGALASLVAIWPASGLWRCLWWEACSYEAGDGSRILLTLALAAILFGLLLGLGVLVSLVRHRGIERNIGANRMLGRTGRG